MTLLFLHIPKTAGTSLDTGWLQRHFQRHRRLCETDLFTRGKLTCRHVFAEMEHISKQFRFQYKDVFGFYARQGLVKLDHEYYAGHICFGIHDLLGGPCRYVTLLRHPVERITSYYNLIHSLGHFTGSFTEYISSKRFEVDNYQVRCLCTGGWSAKRVTLDMFEEAKDNLMQHCLFGVTEQMSASIEIIAASLGIPPPPAAIHLNRTVEDAPIHCGDGKKFQGVVKISRAEREIIVAKNKFGIKLHDFATKRLGQQDRLTGESPINPSYSFPVRLASWFRQRVA